MSCALQDVDLGAVSGNNRGANVVCRACLSNVQPWVVRGENSLYLGRVHECQVGQLCSRYILYDGDHSSKDNVASRDKGNLGIYLCTYATQAIKANGKGSGEKGRRVVGG